MNDLFDHFGLKIVTGCAWGTVEEAAKQRLDPEEFVVVHTGECQVMSLDGGHREWWDELRQYTVVIIQEGQFLYDWGVSAAARIRSLEHQVVIIVATDIAVFEQHKHHGYDNPLFALYRHIEVSP